MDRIERRRFQEREFPYQIVQEQNNRKIRDKQHFGTELLIHVERGGGKTLLYNSHSGLFQFASRVVIFRTDCVPTKMEGRSDCVPEKKGTMVLLRPGKKEWHTRLRPKLSLPTFIRLRTDCTAEEQVWLKRWNAMGILDTNVPLMLVAFWIKLSRIKYYMYIQSNLLFLQRLSDYAIKLSWNNFAVLEFGNFGVV